MTFDLPFRRMGVVLNPYPGASAHDTASAAVMLTNYTHQPLAIQWNGRRVVVEECDPHDAIMERLVGKVGGYG